MSKLPVIDARKLEKILFNLGFKRIRQKGSHVFYRHPDGRYTTIPHHKGRELSRPLIRTILRQIDLSIEEFYRSLEEL